MACAASKTYFLRALATRGFSAQAQPAAAKAKSSEIEGTCLPNKLIIATADNGSPISRVSVVFKAGARNESYDNQGITHILRLAAGLSTKGATQFGITRNIQQLGANLSCTTDRETISYTLEIARDKLDLGLKYLAELATKQAFNPWELYEIAPRLRYELATRSDQARVVDLLHKAAFRTGLGNSLWAPKWQVGRISTEGLSHYTKNNFKTNGAAVVGLGVSHSDLVAYAQGFELDSGTATITPAKYLGGEIRKETGGDLAHVALGVAGAGLNNPNEALAFAVLQRTLGTGPYVTWGTEATSPLTKNLSAVVTNFAASALNASYSDNGLFGVIVSAPAREACNAVEAALATLRSGSVSGEAIQRAKKQLKTAVLFNLESGESALADMGNQALLTGCVQSAAVIAANIDAVKDADVINAAKRAAAGKLSLAAIGNLSLVPHLDQLK